MGFVTLSLRVSAKQCVQFQFSDATLTLARLRSVAALTARRPQAALGPLQYTDDEGDAIDIVGDA